MNVIYHMQCGANWREGEIFLGKLHRYMGKGRIGHNRHGEKVVGDLMFHLMMLGCYSSCHLLLW